MKRAWIVLLMAVPLAAQIQVDLSGLAAKAKESVDISLDSAMLKLAAGFLTGKKSDDAGLQKTLSGLKNITVKSYTFAEEGQYKVEQLDPIRTQLRAAGWGKTFGVNEKSGQTDIYTKSEGGQISGVTVLVAEPKELTVVSIEGVIDLSKLADLAGHFGIPDLPIPGQKSDQKKGKGTGQ